MKRETETDLESQCERRSWGGRSMMREDEASNGVLEEFHASIVTLASQISPGCKTIGLTATAFSTQMKSR